MWPRRLDIKFAPMLATKIADMAPERKAIIKKLRSKTTAKIVAAKVIEDDLAQQLYQDKAILTYDEVIAMTKTRLMGDYWVRAKAITSAFVDKFNNEAMLSKHNNYRCVTAHKAIWTFS